MDFYSPSPKEKETIGRVYREFEIMRNVRNNKWKYFNDRTLKDFIDDSQMRLNGFVPDRTSQGKEAWQSNIFHPVTKNKFKAMLASVALDTPQIRITAQNEKNEQSLKRAEIMSNLVKYSYNQENKEERIFFEAWEAAEKGTVVVYDGYLKTKNKQKIITSYDPTTGEIETEEKEVETDSKCVNFIVPLMNFYIKDVSVFDVQEQPSVLWVDRVEKTDFEREFGKYKKARFVKTSNQLTDPNESETYFAEQWRERTQDEEQIEIIRYWNKGNDEFLILANGVLIHESPILLGKTKKWYPFAKTVFEPFATDFFYGNSLPNTLMGEQDVINSLFNMALDKTYRSMVPPLLIGMVNKDDFDLEDTNISSDTKIYVQDIAQVREMPISGINQSDLKMIELVSRGLDLSSVDSNQQGVAGRGVTAREVVIANENAKKLKGVIYLFLNSLWIQKITLRMMNILIYYTQEKVDKATGKGKEFRTFTIDNTELSDGEKGTMDIQMVGSEEDLPTPQDLDIDEEKYKMQGEKYEKVVMTSNFLDNWHYDIKIVSDSLYQKESGLTQMKIEEKLRVLGTFFPQIIMQNQEKLAKDAIIAFEDDPDDYELGAPQPAPMGMPGEQPVPGMEQATAGQSGLPMLPKL